VNRLLGAVIGILIFLTLVYSFPFLKSDKTIFYLSLLTFILVGFQGWLGSVVVATNLAPWMVTIHMLVAILIVFILIYTVSRSYTGHLPLQNVSNKLSINKVLIATIVLSLVQTVLGTQVREAVDVIAASLGNEQRHIWIEQMGIDFYIHRSFSAVILIAHFYLLYLLKRKTVQKGLIYSYTIFLFAVVVAEIVAGSAMAYGGIPAFLQPIHLLLAVVALGIQFLLLLFINYETVFLKATPQIESKKLSYR
jgi:cytochrome c oxidase assembly protein subunit 15